MFMTDVHSCCQLSAENDWLKRSIRKMQKENAQLKAERDHTLSKKPPVILRSIETQTDVTRNFATLRCATKTTLSSCRCQKDTESEKFNKLLVMHNNLLRRHEKEVQLNVQHMDTVSSLMLKVNELEERLADVRMQQQNSAPCSAVEQQKRSPLMSNADTQLHQNLSECTAEALTYRQSEQLHKLRQKYERLMNNYKSLREELRQINPSFFEEIEDLKFALQQSARLNKEYEETLRRMCNQFGLPYPHPEHVLNTS